MSQETLFIYLAIGVATLITFAMRALGLIWSRRLDENRQIFIYANYLSYALVGALVTKLLILPDNDLVTIPLVWRLGISAFCLTLYLIHRKHLLIYLIVTVFFASAMQFGGFIK